VSLRGGRHTLLVQPDVQQWHPLVQVAAAPDARGARQQAFEAECAAVLNQKDEPSDQGQAPGRSHRRQ